MPVGPELSRDLLLRRLEDNYPSYHGLQRYYYCTLLKEV